VKSQAVNQDAMMSLDAVTESVPVRNNSPEHLNLHMALQENMKTLLQHPSSIVHTSTQDHIHVAVTNSTAAIASFSSIWEELPPHHHYPPEDTALDAKDKNEVADHRKQRRSRSAVVIRVVRARPPHMTDNNNNNHHHHHHKNNHNHHPHNDYKIHYHDKVSIRTTIGLKIRIYNHYRHYIMLSQHIRFIRTTCQKHKGKYEMIQHHSII
jgi:hypothetical protein